MSDYDIPSNAFISAYTPFIILNNNASNREVQIINQAALDENVSKIFITENADFSQADSETLTQATAASVGVKIISQAYKQYHFSDSLTYLNGNAVNIGVIEAGGYPDINNAELSVANITNENLLFQNTISQHATEDVQIMVGSQGIAKEAKVFAAACWWLCASFFRLCNRVLKRECGR